VLRLLVTANDVLNSLFLFTLMMEAILSSETSVLTRSTRSDIPEYCILYTHNCAYGSKIALTDILDLSDINMLNLTLREATAELSRAVNELAVMKSGFLTARTGKMRQ
jgi:hypothetical protein